MKCSKVLCFSVTGILILIAAFMAANHFRCLHCSTEKHPIDRSSQMVTLVALTSAISQVNPFNFEYQKGFIRIFLTAEIYEKVSKEIQARIEFLKKTGELEGDYFVFHSYQYDEKLNKHFVMGEVYSVNSTMNNLGKSYVYEYRVHTDGGNLIADDMSVYPGTAGHDSEWLAKHNK